MHSLTIKAAIFGAFFLIVLLGCRSLGPIEPLPPDAQDEIEQRCRAHFLNRPWQLVQSITAYTPDGEIRNAIGVLHIYPEQKRIKCVIMSIEGFTLFKGEYDQKMKVFRSLPPFDDGKFAGTMFDDIRLIFFPPNARAVETGRTASGVPVCRYEISNEGFVEILFKKGHREIRRYSERKKLLKTIEACYEARCSQYIAETTGEVPLKLTIFNHGFIEYRLELEMIKATALEADQI